MWYPEGLWNEPCYVIHILHFSCLVFVQSFQPHHCCRIANIPGLPLLVYLSSVARFQDHETFRTEGIYRLFMLKAYKYFFFHSRRKTKNLIYLLLLLKSVIDRVMVSHRGMQMNCGKTDLQIRSPGDFLQNLQEHRIMDYALHESTILLLEFGPSWNNLIVRVEVTVLHPISTAGVQHVLMWNGNSIPEPFQLALLQTLALVWHQLSPCSLSGTFCAKRESQLVKSALCSFGAASEAIKMVALAGQPLFSASSVHSSLPCCIGTQLCQYPINQGVLARSAAALHHSHLCCTLRCLDEVQLRLGVGLRFFT